MSITPYGNPEPTAPKQIGPRVWARFNFVPALVRQIQDFGLGWARSWNYANQHQAFIAEWKMGRLVDDGADQAYELSNFGLDEALDLAEALEDQMIDDLDWYYNLPKTTYRI